MYILSADIFFYRDNNLLVSNQPSYDVMVIPEQVKKFDTIEFCNLLKISKKYLKKNLKRQVIIQKNYLLYF